MNIQSQRKARGDLAYRCKARSLNGSRLRLSCQGEADAASDLDLLVEMKPGRSLLDLGFLSYGTPGSFGIVA